MKSSASDSKPKNGVTSKNILRYYTLNRPIRYMNCFEAVARGPDDVSNNRLKFADVPGIRFRLITTSKNNFREIQISRPRP